MRRRKHARARGLSFSRCWGLSWWRATRWLVSAVGLLALWACTSRRLAAPAPEVHQVERQRSRALVPPKLDLLFMVDNSPSMAPLQAKMRARLPDFMDALLNRNTGRLPDLHVAVISSSLGGGAWSNVNQCAAGSHPGDDQGKFQQGPGGAHQGSCSMLHPGATFLQTGDGSAARPPNFDGDIGDAFQCIALLGDTGCGFEAPFASTYYALSKAAQRDDPDNGGFLRDDAILAIVMLTNEDDCSIAPGSLLLDPGVNSVSDPTGLGAFTSYRCNEFGHLCGGQPPPHGAPAAPVTLEGCVSAETDGKTSAGHNSPDGNPDPTHGHLWPTVGEFGDFLRSLKVNPDDVLFAAIAGPTRDRAGNSLYRVSGQANPVAGGEVGPVVEHSCVQAAADPTAPEYADPAVRINQLTERFGPNGIFFPICAADLKTAMIGIAQAIQIVVEPSCFSGRAALLDPDDPTRGHNCVATIGRAGEDAATVTASLPECVPVATGPDWASAPTPTNLPCFQLLSGSLVCAGRGDPAGATQLRICRDPSCSTLPPSGSATATDVDISCAVD